MERRPISSSSRLLPTCLGYVTTETSSIRLSYFDPAVSDKLVPCAKELDFLFGGTRVHESIAYAFGF